MPRRIDVNIENEITARRLADNISGDEVAAGVVATRNAEQNTLR